MFFLEGTFTRIPVLQPFRMGAFVVAAEAGVPIVPMSIRGTRSMLRNGHWFPRGGIVTITIGKPVAPEGKDWAAAIQLLKWHARKFCVIAESRIWRRDHLKNRKKPDRAQDSHGEGVSAPPVCVIKGNLPAKWISADNCFLFPPLMLPPEKYSLLI
ncbi:MAG: 1-acyl-sn-glycerol-3-phosphate acyltransferase [Nitrosomonadales bacterium]|nr:1-acyl-sn-glycerol-3-phosphate acyltransferase [Nitrosomonadales bacterium]